jgi:integrase
MARKVKHVSIESRTARDKLQPRPKPYFVALAGKLHLGYRRRRKGKGAQGNWLTRQYLGMDAKGVGRYREEDIGLADDHLDADNSEIFSFDQAYVIATKRHADNAEQSPNAPLTVAAALDKYFTYLEHEGRPPADAPGRAAKHILPTLGATLVDKLTAERLRAWLADIAKAPADADDETIRRRKSTANRVLRIFRAALNFAFKEGNVNSDKEWRRVKPFGDVDVARKEILTVAQAKRLINASEPGFRKLVQAALSTGARYGELTRLKVKDFNPDSGTLTILRSKTSKKTGKVHDIYLNDEGIAFFEQLAAGRDGNEIMLLPTEGDAWRGDDQTSPMADAVKRAKIPRITFHGLRHTHASLSLMAKTLPLVVAKNLGHSDTRMIEKHYGHLIDSHRQDEIKRGAPVFGFVADDTVVALGGSAASRRRGK